MLFQVPCRATALHKTGERISIAAHNRVVAALEEYEIHNFLFQYVKDPFCLSTMQSYDDILYVTIAEI